MSDYRLRLLQLVADTGSLAQAATAMGLSYRRAWGKVKELEANLGFPLVRSEVGGAGGGHKVLFPEGRAPLDASRRFGQRMDEALHTAYREELSHLARPAEDA